MVSLCGWDGCNPSAEEMKAEGSGVQGHPSYAGISGQQELLKNLSQKTRGIFSCTKENMSNLRDRC